MFKTGKKASETLKNRKKENLKLIKEGENWDDLIIDETVNTKDETKEC